MSCNSRAAFIVGGVEISQAKLDRLKLRKCRSRVSRKSRQ
jgi:hypothetical protein